jgi:hypothetical protein
MLARVFLAARYILDRLLGSRSRADEVYDVRRRLLEMNGPGMASGEEEELARKLLLLREQLLVQLGHVEACARCVRPLASGFAGGHCCAGGTTRDFFGDHELAALRLAGTTAADLRPPQGAHVGCAFRGLLGCSLAAAHRPCVCVGYACRDLWVELHRRGDGSAFARLQDELYAAFQGFVAARKTRMEAAWFEELRGRIFGA